jgi:hypothetical protein
VVDACRTNSGWLEIIFPFSHAIYVCLTGSVSGLEKVMGAVRISMYPARVLHDCEVSRLHSGLQVCIAR